MINDPLAKKALELLEELNTVKPSGLKEWAAKAQALLVFMAIGQMGEATCRPIVAKGGGL